MVGNIRYWEWEWTWDLIDIGAFFFFRSWISMNTSQEDHDDFGNCPSIPIGHQPSHLVQDPFSLSTGSIAHLDVWCMHPNLLVLSNDTWILPKRTSTLNTSREVMKWTIPLLRASQFTLLGTSPVHMAGPKVLVGTLLESMIPNRLIPYWQMYGLEFVSPEVTWRIIYI